MKNNNYCCSNLSEVVQYQNSKQNQGTRRGPIQKDYGVLLRHIATICTEHCLICKQTAVFPPYDNGIELVDMAQAIVEEIILKRNRFFGVTQLDQN